MRLAVTGFLLSNLTSASSDARATSFYPKKTDNTKLPMEEEAVPKAVDSQANNEKPVTPECIMAKLHQSDEFRRHNIDRVNKKFKELSHEITALGKNIMRLRRKLAAQECINRRYRRRHLRCACPEL